MRSTGENLFLMLFLMPRWPFPRYRKFWLFFLAALCIAAPLRSQPAGAGTSPSNPPPAWGVDSGLKRQCIRTTTPDALNFFSDAADCPGSAYPFRNYWTTAVETESSEAILCAGEVNQSFLINGSGSPVSETWTGNSVTGYTVELKTDFTNVANPCPPRSWTWVPLMDNIVGGGPLPSPNNLQTQFHALFTRRLPDSGATRAFAGLGAQWRVAGADGGDAVLRQVQVELNLFTDEPQWGRKPDLPPDVINATRSILPGHSAPVDFVNVDGSRLIPPVSITPSEPQTVTVNWGAVLQHLIDEGLFPSPIHGWNNSAAATIATDAGTEVYNTAAGSNGPFADLAVSNFQESSSADQPAAAPLLDSANPASVESGSGSATLIITGSGFVEGATAYWTQNGQTSSLRSQFVDAGSIAASIPAGLLANPGTATIHVANAGGYANLLSALSITVAPSSNNIVP